VRVYLRGREISVSQQFLYGTKIGSSVQKMSGKRVAKCVGMGWRRRSPIENTAYITRGERVLALIRKQWGTRRCR